ncbi:MAG: hypothetical protein AAF629_23030 [Chloroflexota bacterium]
MAYFFLLLLSLHSIWRWVVLIAVAVAIVKAMMGWMGKQAWTDLDARISRFYPTTFAIQFVLGLIIYVGALAGSYTPIRYLPPSNVLLRLSTEHVLLMFIALGIAGMTTARMKKADSDVGKHKTIAIGFIISLILVIVAIPMASWGFNWYA